MMDADGKVEKTEGEMELEWVFSFSFFFRSEYTSPSVIASHSPFLWNIDLFIEKKKVFAMFSWEDIVWGLWRHVKWAVSRVAAAKHRKTFATCCHPPTHWTQHDFENFPDFQEKASKQRKSTH